MTSINTVAFPKKFSLMSWSFLGAFCPQSMDILIQSIFSPYRVSQKWKMPRNGLKVEINDFNQFNCYPEKVFLYEGEFFLEAFCTKDLNILFKVYFHYTGCPKKWKILWNRLKTEIYDFNQYSCSTEKVFLCEVETFWSLL